MPEQQIQSTRWHARQAEEALLELDSTAAGLTHEQAAQRLLRYGPNRLDEAKRATLQDLAWHWSAAPAEQVAVVPAASCQQCER